jgi:hypothetical protein
MIIAALRRWQEGAVWTRHALMAGITAGWLIVVPLHDAKLVSKLIGTQLSSRRDPLTPVLGWSEMAKVVDQERRALISEGKPVFIIGGDPAAAALLAFYLPETRPGSSASPLVHAISGDEASSPLFFLPGYKDRKGENALYVTLANEQLRPAPQPLHDQFASVADLGTRDILHKKRVLHRIQLFACRDLR